MSSCGAISSYFNTILLRRTFSPVLWVAVTARRPHFTVVLNILPAGGFAGCPVASYSPSCRPATAPTAAHTHCSRSDAAVQSTAPPTARPSIRSGRVKHPVRQVDIASLSSLKPLMVKMIMSHFTSSLEFLPWEIEFTVSMGQLMVLRSTAQFLARGSISAHRVSSL